MVVEDYSNILNFFFLFYFYFVSTLLIFIPVVISVAIVSLLDRKVMGLLQRRKGPNVIGIFGILQPFADGIKLILKEPIIPVQSNKIFFLLGPLISFIFSYIKWSVIQFDKIDVFFCSDYNILFILGMSSLGVYGLILSGWSSNSKYAMFGSMRAAAQMVSYEVVLSFSLLPIIFLSKSLNLLDIIYIQNYNRIWNIFIFIPNAILFWILILAETNRTPFDLPEAEGELVAGYNVEFSSITFAFFFLAEYSNIIFFSFLFVYFFLGGGVFYIVIIKSCILIFCFIWIRATLPRYRFDHLMRLCWKFFMPFLMAYCLYVYSLIYFFSFI